MGQAGASGFVSGMDGGMVEGTGGVGRLGEGRAREPEEQQMQCEACDGCDPHRSVTRDGLIELKQQILCRGGWRGVGGSRQHAGREGQATDGQAWEGSRW